MSDLATVSVTILGKDYQVSCPEEEVEALTNAARYLDQKMADIRASGKVVGLDRIAVMAALNISHELLNGNDARAATDDAVTSGIASLSQKVAAALTDHKQMEL